MGRVEWAIYCSLPVDGKDSYQDHYWKSIFHQNRFNIHSKFKGYQSVITMPECPLVAKIWFFNYFNACILRKFRYIYIFSVNFKNDKVQRYFICISTCSSNFTKFCDIFRLELNW